MNARKTARDASVKLIRSSGLPAAIRRITRHRAQVASYHDPSPEALRAHLRYLRDRYDFVAYDLLVDAIRTRDFGRLPERALALTFDDGLAGNHALLPLFREYRIRPTIFLCTSIVGTDRGYWFNEPLDFQRLKRLPNAERLAVLARTTGFAPDLPRPGPRQALSRDELLEMAEHVDFGSHTRTHPILTRCTDREALDEIEGSRHELEHLLGQPLRHFCAPNGDWGEREVELVRKAGYDSMRTTDFGWTGPDGDSYRIPVAGITDDASPDLLAAQLSGLTRFLRNLASGHLGGAAPRTPAGE